MAGVDYSQFKGKPFQVVSKLGVRYTGIFDHISQEDQTICLAQVFNHGTEDRPTPRKLPGSTTTLGWVRFHTESIESLALVENYIPPGEEAPVDPILASVSNTAPPAAGQAGPAQPPSRRESHDLPPKPSQTAISAATALDRVQESLHDLSVSEPQSDGQRPRRNFRPPPKAPEVPDAEFDFSKGTQAFEKEREGRRITSPRSEAEEIGEPENAPHPSALAAMSSQAVNGNGVRNGQADGAGAKASTAYKKGSFFDGLSGESSRISRNEERHRNFDTFGEAGGNDQSGYAPGAGRGGYGGRGRGGGGGGGGYGGRGGYGQQGQQGGYGRREGYGRQEQGYGGGGGEGYGRGRGRGYGYRGGYGGVQGDQ